MIVITGATGRVGTEVVRGLDGTGFHVRMAVRRLAAATPYLGGTVEAVEMNFDDAGSIERAFTGADHLMLITPPSETQVAWAKRAIDIARLIGLSHIVYLSALGAEVDLPVRFLHWHYEVEQYLQSSGVPCTILRPNAFMENFLHSDAIRREGVLYSTLGDRRVSYIATRDIGETAAEILVTPGFVGKSFDLTGPTAVTDSEVAEALSRATGRKIRYVEVRADDVRRMLHGQPEWLIDGMLELQGYFGRGAGNLITDSVEAITTHPPQDINAWTLEHAAAFAQAA